MLEGKTVLEEEILSSLYYKNGTAEFLRKKKQIREKSALEEDRVRGGPPVLHLGIHAYLCLILLLDYAILTLTHCTYIYSADAMQCKILDKR